MQDGPDSEIIITAQEEAFIEALFEGICSIEVNRENPETPVK
jgi:hypothetical protein